jgi:hypothetical protein
MFSNLILFLNSEDIVTISDNKKLCIDFSLFKYENPYKLPLNALFIIFINLNLLKL